MITNFAISTARWAGIDLDHFRDKGIGSQHDLMLGYARYINEENKRIAEANRRGG